jgi:hypothetical protein
VVWSPENNIATNGFYPAIGTNGNYAITVFYDINDNLLYSTAWVP